MGEKYRFSVSPERRYAVGVANVSIPKFLNPATIRKRPLIYEHAVDV